MATPRDALASFEALLIERGKFYNALLSPITQRGYSYDWKAWEKWCTARGFNPLPATPESISLYAVDALAKHRKTSTVARLIAGINHTHRQQGYPVEWNVHVQQLLRGARRLRHESLVQSIPLTVEDVRQMAVALAATGSIRDLRNRALILTGFCSALRSNSLAALELADLEFEARGAILHVRRSKTDQEGHGRLIGLPYGKHPETCVVRGLQDWVKARGSFRGPLFCHVRNAGGIAQALHPETIGSIVQAALRLIGRDPAGYGGHSLRSGLVTAAGDNDVELLRIAGQTGHRNMSVLKGYFRRRDVFRGNVLASIDL